MADGVEALEAKEAGNTSWVRTVKDLSAGAAGGIAQVLLGESLACGVEILMFSGLDSCSGFVFFYGYEVHADSVYQVNHLVSQRKQLLGLSSYVPRYCKGASPDDINISKRCSVRVFHSAEGGAPSILQGNIDSFDRNRSVRLCAIRCFSLRTPCLRGTESEAQPECFIRAVIWPVLCGRRICWSDQLCPIWAN